MVAGCTCPTATTSIRGQADARQRAACRTPKLAQAASARHPVEPSERVRRHDNRARRFHRVSCHVAAAPSEIARYVVFETSPGSLSMRSMLPTVKPTNTPTAPSSYAARARKRRRRKLLNATKRAAGSVTGVIIATGMRANAGNHVSDPAEAGPPPLAPSTRQMNDGAIVGATSSLALAVDVKRISATHAMSAIRARGHSGRHAAAATKRRSHQRTGWRNAVQPRKRPMLPT